METSTPTLTAPFTPPANCDRTIPLTSIDTGQLILVRNSSSVCVPPMPDAMTILDNVYPGPSICPNGYTTAFSSNFTSGLYLASQDVCCPSGYSYPTTYAAETYCTKHLTTKTIAYTFTDDDYITTGVPEPRNPDLYPHTVYCSAIRFRSITRKTDDPVWTRATRSFGATQIPTIDGSHSIDTSQIESDLVISIGVLLFLIPLILFGLFYHFRSLKLSPKKAIRTGRTPLQLVSQNRFLGWKPYSPRSFGLGLFFSLASVFPVGLVTCYFASQAGLQQWLVAWTQDTSAVLRVLQVSSFFMRLLSTSLAWGIMSDLGWMLAHLGTTGSEMVTLLDMSVVGGSYPTAFDAFWNHLRKANTHSSLLLFLVIITVAAADLVGVFIVASTSVTNHGISQMFSSVAYFIGFDPDGAILNSSRPIFSSTDFYPHILLHGEQIAFLPIQLDEPVPLFYSGPAFGGNFSHECVPADLDGTVVLNDPLLIKGAITAHLSRGLRSEQVNCSIPNGNLDISGSAEIDDSMNFIFSCIVGDPDYNWDGSLRFLVLNVSKGVSDKKLTVRGQSSGTPPTEDKPWINWTLYICDIVLPYLVGDVVASEISAAETLLYSDSHGIYPMMPIHETHMTFSVWDKNAESDRLGQPHRQPDDATQLLINDFNSLGGVVFCRVCIGGPPAADKRISGLVGDSSPENLSKALSVALLHAMASAYRSQMPYFQTGYPCQYSLPLSATVVTRPGYLYAACIYTFCLAIVALTMRSVVLRKIGMNRTGFVLSTCSAVQDSPLQPFIGLGGMKNKDTLLGKIDEIRGTITLGSGSDYHEMINLLVEPDSGKKSADQDEDVQGSNTRRGGPASDPLTGRTRR